MKPVRLMARLIENSSKSATKDLLHLNLFLTKLSGILSEVFHTCDTTEERREFEEFIDRVNSILTPTIIQGDTL
jgi:hypothetical protein